MKTTTLYSETIFENMKTSRLQLIKYILVIILKWVQIIMDSEQKVAQSSKGWLKYLLIK